MRAEQKKTLVATLAAIGLSVGLGVSTPLIIRGLESMDKDKSSNPLHQSTESIPEELTNSLLDN